MGRFVPLNLNITVAEVTAIQQPGAKVYYNGKQCWQYKAVYEIPGDYTWTAPEGITCARSVLIGGGGKPTHQSSTCCSYAGAGGAYSEKCMAVGSGTSFCIIVGKQEQDTTISCNGTPVHTAGGATCCTPGVATGGDWNSLGGRPGFSCNYCGGSYSHHCGSCTYIDPTTCCGYCVVYGYKTGPAGGSVCCGMNVPGGASAGSPKHLCGGCSSLTCGWCNDIAGGGGGIGTQCCQYIWHYNCCSCICTCYCTSWHFAVHYPPSLEGGGGSQNIRQMGCRGWAGQCMGGIYRTGAGGSGGPENTSASGFEFQWGTHNICAYPYGGGYGVPEVNIKSPQPPPCRVDWWDIEDICGTGAPGAPMAQHSEFNCQYGWGIGHGIRPENSGEGAGTAGIGTGYCCNARQVGLMFGAAPMVHWEAICCYGQMGWDTGYRAWKLRNNITPNHLTCAGTLGGSGGTMWCNMTQRAGPGGGGGSAKCHIVCVCYGGSYDLCNGSGPSLEFSPCILDTLTSNAGTGMAIIYYKEA